MSKQIMNTIEAELSPKKAEIVNWVDSFNRSYGWNEVIETDMPRILTVGFVLYEDDEKIIMSHSVGGETHDVHFDLFTIPKICIEARTELKLEMPVNGESD